MFDSLRSTTLTRFILLYAAMYAAFGVASPFLPGFISARGLAPEELGLVLAAGTAVRLLTAPLAGRIGDLTQALRFVLVICIALAASVTLRFSAGRTSSRRIAAGCGGLNIPVIAFFTMRTQ